MTTIGKPAPANGPGGVMAWGIVTVRVRSRAGSHQPCSKPDPKAVRLTMTPSVSFVQISFTLVLDSGRFRSFEFGKMGKGTTVTLSAVLILPLCSFACSWRTKNARVFGFAKLALLLLIVLWLALPLSIFVPLFVIWLCYLWPGTAMTASERASLELVDAQASRPNLRAGSDGIASDSTAYPDPAVASA